MRNLLIILFAITFLPCIANAQIQMLDVPTKLASYESTIGALLTLYNVEPGAENNCTESCYFITYYDTEYRDNYETLYIGNNETALEFREIIYQSFSLDDFADASNNDTKQIRFRIEDQTVTIVRQYTAAQIFLGQELSEEVTIWLNVDYGAYMGSTANISQTGWENVLEYFD